MMDSISIQAQDPSGNWRTYLIVMGSARVTSEMQALQRRLPDYRIRAIDNGGRLVDIL
jgi:hypothetical protein